MGLAFLHKNTQWSKNVMTSSPLLLTVDETHQNLAVQHPRTSDFQRSNIALFFDRSIIQDLAAHESCCHLVARRILQGTSVVASFAARIPFIEVNLKLGGDNKIYGGFLAYGACASFGYLVSYSLLEIVDTQMLPLTREEKILTESRMSSTLKKTFFVGATALGVVTQIPFAFIAHKYNDPSTLNPHGLLMPIMVIAIDSWVSTYSGYMGLKTLREQRSLDAYERDLLKVRGKMYALIEANRQLLALAGQETRLDFVRSYNRIKIIDESPDRVTALYTLFTDRIIDQTLEPSPCARRIDNTVKAYGYLCAFCNIGTLGYISWVGTDKLANSLGLDITITALYVGTALYLNTTAIPQTAVTLFNLFKSLFTCSYQPTLSDQLTPKLSFTLKALGLATAALSYGIAIELSKDYYKSQEGLEVFMEITLTSATTFLVSMAILSITDQLLETKIEHFGSEEEKGIIKVYKKMKHFSSVLASSPLIEVACFLKVLPETAVQELIANTEITLTNLGEFIDRNSV